jgi:iron complex outermembrane receptor protein
MSSSDRNRNWADLGDKREAGISKKVLGDHYMSVSSNKVLPSAAIVAAVALAIAAPTVRAQQVAQETASEASLQEVIVTGTRQTGLEASESPAPIQIVSSVQLSETGKPDLMSALATLVPSFVVQAFGFDLQNQTIEAKLRGLSPNHVLILVNGKRRHTTANLAVDQSAFEGGAGADLSFIPIAAIDHVEVLTQGAAAQYGSDAIAGVINIILKRNSSGGSADALYGGNFDGGGTTGTASANAGFQPLDDSGSYFNVTAEIRNHGHTNRGYIDPRVIDPTKIDPADGGTYPYTNEPLANGYPYVNKIQGDAESHVKVASFNSGFDLPADIQFYAFGTYGYKEANSYENYRTPDKATYTDPVTLENSYLYPFGYSPQEQLKETDYQLTAGFKGTVATWNWDLASEYGEDHDVIYTIDSANNSLYAATGASPVNFLDGTFITTQWTTTLDLNRDFDVGMAGPLNVAFGAEYRKESYQIIPGEASSYTYSGAASFAGYAPNNATDQSRKNYAGYVDLAGKPIDSLQVDLAGRYEHYSDFGSATVGKLTARYDLTPAFAVRGTVSTGFRAPTLAEEFYTGINVGPTTAFGQLAPNGHGSALLGLGGGLSPEKSNNYSLGFVFRPMPSLSMTLDIYDIEVRNRIVGTGNINGQINGVPVPGAENITAALVASGLTLDPAVVATGSTGINLFANGINTRTKGVDYVLTSPQDYIWGHVDWSIGATWNETTITKVIASPAELGGQPLFDATAYSDLTTTSPKVVVNLGLAWSLSAFSVNLHEIIYGPSTEWQSDLGDSPTGTPIYYNNRIGTIPITNLELGLTALKGLKFAVGANNLFNRYPEKLNGNLTSTFNAVDDNAAVQKYPGFSPFGIDGGFYYAKVSFRF